MGDAYRIATKVPWEDDLRDWSARFSTAAGAAHDLQDRARAHRGKGYRVRVHEPGDDWGPRRSLKELDDTAARRLEHMGFGDVLWIKNETDGVEWRIRKLHDEDPPDVQLPEANTHVDYLYGYLFREHRGDFPGIESWGTCNRRYIAGTTTWSEHSPWLAPDPGCNALDVHASYAVMNDVAHRVDSLPHVAKVLFYNHEWTKATGWISANIGHYDHVHIEGPRDHGGLAAACHY